MQNTFNLYRFYDKTLADVHQMRRDDRQRRLDAVAQEGEFRRKLIRLMYIAAGVVCTTIVITFVLFRFFIPINVLYPYFPFLIPEEAVEKEWTITDTRTPEEKMGYTRLAKFTFEGDVVETAEGDIDFDYAQAVVVSVDTGRVMPPGVALPDGAIYVFDKETEVPADNATVNYPVASDSEVLGQAAAQKAAAQAKAAAAKRPKPYKVVFTMVTIEQKKRIEKLAAQKKASVSANAVGGGTVWNVFRENASGSTMIGGKRVTSAGTFPSKEAAVQYAKTLGVSAVVQSSSGAGASYNVTVVISTLESAKNFAVSAGIRDKIIRISRYKQ